MEPQSSHSSLKPAHPNTPVTQMCQLGSSASHYPEAPSDLLIKLEVSGFFRPVTREEGILHFPCPLCYTLTSSDHLCCIKKQRSTMPQINILFGIKLPFPVWGGNNRLLTLLAAPLAAQSIPASTHEGNTMSWTASLWQVVISSSLKAV